MYRLGWFSTGRGPGSRGLLKSVQEAIQSGEITARIEFVFCSREAGETEATDVFLQMVRDYQIPLVALSCRKFKRDQAIPNPEPDRALPQWRLDYDRTIMAKLKDFHPDLCVLAGYMLIVGPEMCRRYHMLNLHPATPGGPAGTWQEVIWHLIENHARESGVMTHLVTPELDKGPCVSYCTFPIAGGEFDRYWAEIQGKPVDQVKREQGENSPLFKLIRQHGLEREVVLIKSTVKAFAAQKVRITPDKKVVDSRGRPIKGYDLTGEVDRRIDHPG